MKVSEIKLTKPRHSGYSFYIDTDYIRHQIEGQFTDEDLKHISIAEMEKLIDEIQGSMESDVIRFVRGRVKFNVKIMVDCKWYEINK